MNKTFHSSARMAGIFLAAFMLIGLWAAGSVAESSGPAESVWPAVSAAEAPSAFALKAAHVPEIVTPAVRLSHKKFAHDLRRPRAPRQRSERPSSFSSAAKPDGVHASGLPSRGSVLAIKPPARFPRC